MGDTPKLTSDIKLDDYAKTLLQCINEGSIIGMNFVDSGATPYRVKRFAVIWNREQGRSDLGMHIVYLEAPHNDPSHRRMPMPEDFYSLNDSLGDHELQGFKEYEKAVHEFFERKEQPRVTQPITT